MVCSIKNGGFSISMLVYRGVYMEASFIVRNSKIWPRLTSYSNHTSRYSSNDVPYYAARFNTCFFSKTPLQLFFFKWLFYKKILPVTATYQNTLECIVYIAVLLLGPQNNQVFVDFPCGRRGCTLESPFPEAAARKSLQEREREERSRSRNCESRR